LGESAKSRKTKAFERLGRSFRTVYGASTPISHDGPRERLDLPNLLCLTSLLNIMVKIAPKTPNAEPANAPERILEAARAEFVAKGFAGARMQAIARSAGVNHALLHYYFGSKEKLYEAALREILQAVWGGMRGELQALPKKPSFEELLRTLLKAHARIITGHPGFLPFILREFLNEGRMPPGSLAEILESFGEVPRRINEALLAEIKAGRIRPISPVHFWMNMVGMAAGGFIAAGVLKRYGNFTFAADIEFSEKFFLERAEMIAAILIQGLRPSKEKT
jgi:TetR/AcrR family transcriptional regulator